MLTWFIERRRYLTAGVGALAAALLLAACASSANTNVGSGPLARLQQDGKIRVGTDATYAPSEFMDKDGETVIGFDRELFDAVAAKLHLRTEWVASKFGEIIPAVQSGKYDIGVSSFTINKEREKQVLMVSYFSAGTQWTTRNGNPAGVDPDHACGKRIAVQKDTVQQTEDLPARSKKCKEAGEAEIKVDPYQNQTDATAAVVSGKDDAMLADSPVAAYAVGQSNGRLELLGEVYEAAPYGFVLRQDQHELAKAIQDAVHTLMTDGTYGKILHKWGVSAGAITEPAINP